MANPNLEQLEIGIADPTFSPLQGSEEASPEEERIVMRALKGIMEYMYSEQGLANVAQALQQDDREPFEKVAEISAMLIQKATADIQGNQEVPPSVYFGEGGLLQTVPALVFDVAKQLNIPGAEDQDQLAGSVINLYKMAGEHILETGDEGAVQEAEALGQEVALMQQDGTMQSPEAFIKSNSAASGKADLTSSISRGLLGA